MSSMEDKDYLSIQDLRQYLGISQTMAYQLIRREDFPSCRIGKLIRIPRKALQEWLDRRCAAGEEGDHEVL